MCRDPSGLNGEIAHGSARPQPVGNGQMSRRCGILRHVEQQRSRRRTHCPIRYLHRRQRNLRQQAEGNAIETGDGDITWIDSP